MILSFPTLSRLSIFGILISTGSLSAEIRLAPNANDVESRRRQVEAVYEGNQSVSLPGEVKIEVKTPSLLARSEYLVGVRGFTLVPKGSVVGAGKYVTVLSTPPAEGKLLGWDEFYRLHRAHLRLLAITEKQWSGKDSLETMKDKLASALEGSQTVLTSLNGQLVSLEGIQELITNIKK